jgi:hypothetical protein
MKPNRFVKHGTTDWMVEPLRVLYVPICKDAA